MFTRQTKVCAKEFQAMKPFFRSVFIASMALATLSTAVRADDAVPLVSLEKGQLKCGDALVSAEARCLAFPENQTQCTSQVLRLVNQKKGISKPLPLDGKSIAQDFVKEGPVLDAYVTSWACLTSKAGKSYVYLFYICVESDKRPDCVGTNREWPRLFDTDGKYLSAGHRRHGPQYQRLMRKLGFGSHLSRGIALQNIDESPLKDAPQSVRP